MFLKVIPLIASVIVLFVRVRLINNIRWNKDLLRPKYFVISLLQWVIITLILLSPNILSDYIFIDMNSVRFWDSYEIIKFTGRFLIIWSILILWNFLWFLSKTKTIITFMIAWLLWIMSGLIKFYETSFFIITARSEEFIKLIISIFWKTELPKLQTDILIWWLFWSLWFATVETFLYAITISSDWWIMTTIWRWLTSFIIHILSSFLIIQWVIFMINKDNKKFLIAMFLWIWYHSIYNISIANWYILITISFLIIWYFWLTYFLSNIDRLYIENEILD